MALNTHYMPAFLEEFRSMKLDLMLRDLHKCTPEELLIIQKEIEQILEDREFTS